jgi:putative endopeptidase
MDLAIVRGIAFVRGLRPTQACGENLMRVDRFSLLVVISLTVPTCLPAQVQDSRRATQRQALSSAGCGADGTLAPMEGDQSGHGFDLSDLDHSVAPCDDFYQFVNGGWLKKNSIPPEYPAWGVGQKLQQSNEEVLRGILEEAAKDKKAVAGSNWQKIGGFYASCMNESRVESAGLKALEAEFEQIARLTDMSGLQEEIARLHRAGTNVLFGFGSQQDIKDSTQVIAAAQQGGLGLPDRDYYTRDDEQSKQTRQAYIRHVTNMFKLMGDASRKADAEAKAVMQIETSLAQASMDLVSLRDPEKIYHKLPLGGIQTLTPHFSWELYYRQVGAPTVSSMNIAQPDFFKAADEALTSVSIADWQVYLRWHLVHSLARTLPSKFVEEDFDFYGRTLTGQKEMLPRWRRCVRETDAQLGEALGQYFVQRKFPPESKAKALAMVKNLISALRDDLFTLDWMSSATREQAIHKLSAISIKIGYPDRWRDYSALKVDSGPYAANVLRGDEFAFAYDLGKIGKLVNRGEWDMTPPTVNAYYNPNLNEVVFPAGILQPPYFDPDRDDAMNYGEIGAAIGHELTHGFDDEGARFDAQGNLKDWWTPEDMKNFQARGECIVKQFDAFEVEPGLHENGKLVEGESIADLGGLVIAYAAFRNSLKGKPEPGPIDGFTADERFFISFAQSWADNFRPEYARLIAQTNVHPIDRFRTLGPIANMPEFAKAFECKTKSPMVRQDRPRCRIW